MQSHLASKVNLEAMLHFLSYARGGPMPLAGAPRDLYTQLLAVLRKELTQ